jgi:hypothetical protein
VSRWHIHRRASPAVTALVYNDSFFQIFARWVNIGNMIDIARWTGQPRPYDRDIAM